MLVLDEGNGARQVLESKDGPIRSVIVGIVDEINVAKTPGAPRGFRFNRQKPRNNQPAPRAEKKEGHT